MINKYILFAVISIFIVFLSYAWQFYFNLDYELSKDPSVWAQLGDYAGGLLNPILSFISLVLLIKSLTLQNDANDGLRKEIKSNEQNEKLRSFETHFFNMINSQKLYFDTFEINVEVDGVIERKFGVNAVMFIEDEIYKIRGRSHDDALIIDFLNEIDESEKLFNITRVFYIIVKMTSDKLSDENGFDDLERKSHLTTLINFTEFSLLRLLMMNIQFMDYYSVDYLKYNPDLTSVIEEVKLGYNLY